MLAHIFGMGLYLSQGRKNPIIVEYLGYATLQDPVKSILLDCSWSQQYRIPIIILVDYLELYG